MPKKPSDTSSPWARSIGHLADTLAGTGHDRNLPVQIELLQRHTSPPDRDGPPHVVLI
ncbi:hypothetical protein [Mycobacterium sp. URHB0021]